jgi:predicted DNA-binding transcriptional regulator AlpA
MGGLASRRHRQIASPAGGRPEPCVPEHVLRYTPRRCLSRVEAATYIGVSASKFDEMVIDGRMPKPRQIDGRVVVGQMGTRRCVCGSSAQG